MNGSVNPLLSQSLHCPASNSGWRWDQENFAPPISCQRPISRPYPVPLPKVPTSEDVDRELSRPRLFFPGGLLLVLKESLLPAAGGGSEKEVRG